jgi:hypothetical protein
MNEASSKEVPPQNRPTLDVDGAFKEIQEKGAEGIQFDTACKWAARALASYQMAVQSANKMEIAERFTEGDCFRDEALEHAAQINDDCKLRNFLNKEMLPARQSALEAVVKGGE